ncbi:MAG TPA: hypothetical protein VKR58_15410 [Aquella sp.]|nr:hypothetical protein [Aquella sp.]
MIELKPEITKELNDMVNSLESAKEELNAKFNSVLEEYTSKAFENFYNIIEYDTRYNFERWIRSTCDNIIEGLLAGDMKYVEHANLFSDYDWEKLRKMRIAIWEVAGGELANATIASLLRENEKLKEEVKRLLKYI